MRLGKAYEREEQTGFCLPGVRRGLCQMAGPLHCLWRMEFCGGGGSDGERRQFRRAGQPEQRQCAAADCQGFLAGGGAAERGR